MKNSFFYLWLSLLIITINNPVKGQFYGQVLYPRTAGLTSGFVTTLNPPGYLMAGNNIGSSGSNFFIDHTDASGGFTGTGTFNKEYAIYTWIPSCFVGVLGIVSNCYGVSVIETNISGLPYYALAGTFDQGVFFCILNTNGKVVSSTHYPFPSPVSGSGAKPLLVESSSSPNTYFIAGSYGPDMYVLSVQPTIPLTGISPILWSQFFTQGPLTFTDPKDIIESPYMPNEVIIVGRSEDASINMDGFFLRLNSNNGSQVAYKTYGLEGCDYFTSIVPAFCSTGGSQGYVIVGLFEPLPPLTPTAWILKLDVNGNVIWKHLIYDVNGLNVGPPTDVLERVNNSGNYEYYAVDVTGNNLTVFKLDDTGSMFGGPNQFTYAGSGSGWAYSGPFISNINYSSIDDGIQAYTTDNTSTSSNYYCVKAYFNGISGCNETIDQIQSNYEYDLKTTNLGLMPYGSFGYCTDFQVKDGNSPIIPNYICSNTSIGGGSNARISTNTFESSNDNFDLYKLYSESNNNVITIEANDKLVIDIVVVNELGQIAAKYQLNENNTYQIKIENLPVGLYQVIGTSGNIVTRKKLITPHY